MSSLRVILILIITSYIFQEAWTEDQTEKLNITWLKTGTRHQVDEHKELSQIFCHCGDRKTIISSLRSVYVELRGTTSYKLFEGGNASDVVVQYKTHLSSWIPLLPWRQSQFSIPAFTNHCIGITSDTSYKVTLIVRTVNYWRVLQLLCGVALFLSAPSVCRNVCFYYTAGISVGVLASLLILVFIISRFMPKKTAAYSVLFFGWSAVLYLVQLLWFNMREILVDYSDYLIGYLSVSALVAFAICYRYKPMSDARSQDLIQWSFQLSGLLLVFFASEFQEFSLALIMIILTLYNFPAPWIAKLRTYWCRRFPPKIKLLTEEEYIRQGCEETHKNMLQLRSFCQSPQCPTWKVIGRLKDPLRFAKFVEGDSHLTDEEMLKYDTDLMSLRSGDAELTEDDSSSDGDAFVNHTPSTHRLREMFS